MIECRDDVVLALSPLWRVRPDRDGALIYKHSFIELKWHTVCAPLVFALALMDGRRSVKEIVATLVELLDLADESEGRHLVEGVIQLSNSSEEPFLLQDPAEGTDITLVSVKRFLQLAQMPEDPEGSSLGQLAVPIQLLLMPTNACQTDCAYCYAERRAVPPREQLAPERWCEIIDEAGRLGIDLAVFSGGDPLMYAGIDRLLEQLQKWQVSYLLPTKTFVSPRRAETLARLSDGVGTIQLSIDGVTPAVVDRLIGRPGFCEGAWSSLKSLIQAGANVRTHSVITPYNLAEVPELVNRLHDVGVPDASLTNYSRSFYRHDDALFLSPDQMTELLDRVAEARTRLDWPELSCNAGVNDPAEISTEKKAQSWPKRSACSGGKSGMCITPTGEVILCEQMPQEPPFIVGDVKSQSLLEVWQSAAVRDFVLPDQALSQGTACGDCEDFDACHRGRGRCFRDAYFMYGGLYSPPPLCPRAPRAERMG